MTEEFKPLTIEETNELIKQAKNDDEVAKEKLIQGNFPLIKSIIKNYQNKGVEYDDLYQLGCVGFLKAINNFDERFEVKFSTYAVPMIAGEIKRYLRDDGSIKVSRAIKALWLKIRGLIDERKKMGEAQPTIEEMAKLFEVDSADIVYAMDSAQSLVSLNAQLDENSNNSQSVIDKVVGEDKSEQILDKILLKEAISKLPDRERKILLFYIFHILNQHQAQ